jgi:hypothetical protein
MDAIIIFGAQELRIGAISSKMVEAQFEDDKIVDMVFTTLWIRLGV